MASRRGSTQDQSKRPLRPARTPEGRENQMVALAMDLAEKRLREGTATSQEIVHYLKLGTSREKLEQERLARENELLQAKVEAIASAARTEELYKNALQAMRSYSGQPPIDFGDENED